jgi:hypothetical protein
MRYARTLKIVDHDGTGHVYRNVLYRDNPDGVEIHLVEKWAHADYERMEVDLGTHAEAPHTDPDGERDAGVAEVPGISITRPYVSVFGRFAEGPHVDDSELSDGC